MEYDHDLFLGEGTYMLTMLSFLIHHIQSFIDGFNFYKRNIFPHMTKGLIPVTQGFRPMKNQ